MARVKKSTMVEFVQELETLKSFSGHPQYVVSGLNQMIAEAKAGEFHDYKNEKYTCGKMAASAMLRQMGFIDLAKRIEEGEFDEEADEADKAKLKADAMAGGLTEEMCKQLFGL